MTTYLLPKIFFYYHLIWYFPRNKEKNEAMKKISEEMGAPFILVDSSRGAENATVVLQPGTKIALFDF